MLELNEQNFRDLTTGTGKSVIMVYGDGCGHCKNLEPVFAKVAEQMPEIKFGKIKPGVPSEFKRMYMKLEKGEKDLIPVILVFENSALLWKRIGELKEEDLKKFIIDGTQPPKPEPSPQQNMEMARQQRLQQLYAMKGERVTVIEINQAELTQINQELGQLLGRRNGNT